jgi:protein-tyrosine phosphatase
MGYVDLHSHVLPEVDDGAQSFAESLDMLAAASRAGTRHLVATPHMFQPGLGSDDPAAIEAAFSDFSERLDRRRSEPDGAAIGDLEIHLGSENFVCTELLAAVASRRVLTLAGSRYLLIEFWPPTTATSARRAVNEIQNAGYVPILAHVERYSFLQEEPSRLEQLVEAGCVAQVNGTAILGLHGLRITQLTDRWLRRRLIGVVASDSHGVDSRRPELDETAAQLVKRYGPATERLCLHDNPHAVLADETTSLPSAEQPTRWWRRR